MIVVDNGAYSEEARPQTQHERKREREAHEHTCTRTPLSNGRNGASLALSLSLARVGTFQMPISRMTGPVFGCRVHLYFALLARALSIGIAPVIARCCRKETRPLPISSRPSAIRSLPWHFRSISRRVPIQVSKLLALGLEHLRCVLMCEGTLAISEINKKLEWKHTVHVTCVTFIDVSFITIKQNKYSLWSHRNFY